MGATWENWRGNQQCRPARLVRPASLEEVVEAVAAAGREGQRLRVVGGGLSWSGLVPTDGWLMELDRLNQLLDLDRDTGRVTVQAGIRLWQLNALLEAEGLALGNLGAVTEQSIAGATATGTHGTGTRIGNLATFITGLELVTADGEVNQLEAGDERFPAAALSLGALGVVTRVTLQCEPAFGIRSVEELLPFAEGVERLPEAAAATEHFQALFLPHSDHLYFIAMGRIPVPPGRHVLVRGAKRVQAGLQRGASRALVKLTNLLPGWTPTLMRLAARTEFAGRERVGRSFEILPLLNISFRYSEMEYAIPMGDCQAALRELRQLIRQNGWRMNFPVTIRFAQADELWLSPAYRRDSCYLSVATAGTGRLGAGFEPMFRSCEALCTRHGGRPHWGKHFYVDPSYLGAQYSQFDAFAELRDALDPEGRFVNPFIDSLFGAGRAP